MSNLVKHAEHELTKAGLLGSGAHFYDKGVADAVIELVNVFAKQGHSGFSASMTIELFKRCASYEALTPLTSDPSEWLDRSIESGEPLWQNKRQSSTFSRDGGKTWYDLNDPKDH